jgi:oligopeptide/dipeptide ABC transporter ATP-binding protein
MSIRRLIEEPLKLHTPLRGAALRAEAVRLAERVHLSRAQIDRAPGELSGGQLQRVCIARAVATQPALIVLDEPTSSLDLSVRAGILDLLAEIRVETGAAMLFITHDLATLRAIADRVAVLYLGHVLEEGPTERVMDAPAHPYTQALLSAHLPADPAVHPRRIRLEGEIPSPMARPEGCPFQTRCPLVEPRCRAGRPPLLTVGSDQAAACVRVVDGSNRIAA